MFSNMLQVYIHCMPGGAGEGSAEAAAASSLCRFWSTCFGPEAVRPCASNSCSMSCKGQSMQVSALQE